MCFSCIYFILSEPLKTPILFLKTPPKPIYATKPQNPSGRASTELRFLGVLNLSDDNIFHINVSKANAFKTID
ncbi:MAG: hypothetical protein EAZ27_09540 [Cytophagales bacterium]|nr:MAG: hypothetical protein EAZ27_09540 [Cytophagales bacterium]